MEEENKKEEKCCENGSCEKCKHCPMMACCAGKKHCHFLKLLIVVVVLVVIFCLGVQLGELKEEARSCHSSRGGMMNWEDNGLKPMMYNFKITDGQQNVAPETTTPTPEVKQ